MIFPTFDFAVFFLVVYALNWTIRDRKGLWKAFMLVASWFFYGYWDWRFVPLLVLSSIYNHWLAIGIERSRTPGRRRALLVVALVANLGCLAFFKYAAFLVEQAYRLAFRLPGEPNLDVWLPVFDSVGHIILPLGISFFTFQALSYIGDVYRNRMRTTDTWLDFALYLAFFPQLVAGPIVRAVHLVGQVAKARIPDRIDTGRAVWLILGGLFKKIVVANYLGVRIVDPVFSRPDLYGAWDTLIANYAFLVQIYCDFSAYSDMAIGFCLLLGFRIPLNFDAPLFSDTIRDFWRRWHISLSSFLRDYLYIPLGGSRKGEPRVHINLMITFVLGGLWHGASWTFVVWGALMGFFLSVERIASRWMNARQLRWEGVIPGLIRRVLVWHAICASCLFFRGQSWPEAVEMLRAFARWSDPVRITTLPILAIIVIGFLTQLLDGNRCERAWNAFARLHPAWQGLTAAVIYTIILGLGPTGVAPFIYFQF